MKRRKRKKNINWKKTAKSTLKIIHTKQYKPLVYAISCYTKSILVFFNRACQKLKKILAETIFVSLQADKMPRFPPLVTLHPPPIVRNSDIRFPSLWTVEKEPKTWCAYSG